MKKIISKVLIIFIVIVTLLNFILSCNVSHAAINLEDSINLIANLAGGIVSIIYWPNRLQATGIAFIADMVVATLAKVEGVNYGSDMMVIITPFDIFFNRFKLLDVDFFDIPSDTNTMIYDIRVAVANWFYAMRTIASAMLLVILIYVGIRMALASVAEDKAKYKKMLFDWCCSLALIFILQYICIFTIYCNNAIVNSLKSAMGDLSAEDTVGNILIDVGLEAVLGIGITSICAVLVFCMIVFQTIGFLLAYITRMIKVGFLIIISPLISLTYAIDKMGDGKAQALNMWLKEFVYTILIQPFHCVMYMAFVRTALKLLVAGTPGFADGVSVLESATYNQLVYGLLAILCLKFINDGEKIVRKIFGFQDDNSATSMAAGMAVGMAAVSNAKKIGSTTRKGINSTKQAASNFRQRFKGASAADRKTFANSALGKSKVGHGLIAVNDFIGKGVNVVGKTAKKVASAPKNIKNNIAGKFRRSKVAGNIRDLAKNNKFVGGAAKAGRKISGYMKSKNSLAGALGMMTAAAAYSSGSGMLESYGLGSAVSRGTGEVFQASQKNLGEASAEQNMEEDRKEWEELNKNYEEASQSVQALSDNKDKFDAYESAKKDLATAEGDFKTNDEDRFNDLNEKNNNGTLADLDRDEYNSLLAKKQAIDQKRAEVLAQKVAIITALQGTSVARNNFPTPDKVDEKTEIPEYNQLVEQQESIIEKSRKELEGFFSEQKIRERILDRVSSGSSTAELEARKNRLVQALTRAKLAEKGDSQDSHTLTVDEKDSVNRTAEMLMQNISLDVLKAEGFDDSKYLSGIKAGLGLQGDLKQSSSYQDIQKAISDYDSIQRNIRTAEVYSHNRSLNGEDYSLATREARMISDAHRAGKIG